MKTCVLACAAVLSLYAGTRRSYPQGFCALRTRQVRNCAVAADDARILELRGGDLSRT